MIKKFQQGGSAEDAMMQFIQGLAQTLQADPNEIIQVAQQNPDALKAAVQVFSQTKDMNQAAQVFSQALQQQVQAAKHGAKLQYLRKLKNQCGPDEEVYYYKKGGSVKCGCMKKLNGGPVTKDNSSQKTIKKEPKKESTNPAENPNLKYDPKTKKYVPVTEEDRKRWKKNLEDARNGKGEGEPQHKCGGKVKKHQQGSIIDQFKQAFRKGGSLNGVPFYQGGTPEGGIEKSDNTRVQRIPNNGEGVYEQIPVNGWNFVPIVGTLKEAKMLDQGDPNASVTRLGISLAGDLVGAGMIGSVAKAAGRVNGIQKALRTRGYQQFTKDGSQWFRLPKKIIRGYGDKLYTYEIPNIYGGSSFKTIPTVDYTPAVMAPLVQTLRVPAEAPFFNYSR